MVPTPILTREGGTPCPDLGRSIPIQTWEEDTPLPHVQTWKGGTNPPGWQMGVPPQSKCELTNKLKTVPSLILRMRAINVN